MRIFTSSGDSFLIDDSDVELVSSGSWWVQGSPKKGFYVAGRIIQDGIRRKVLLHRLRLGANPCDVVDHINRDSLDNRRANLRICSRSQNNCNQRQKSSSPAKNVLVERASRGRMYWTAKVTMHGTKLQARFPYTEEGLLLAIACAAEFRKQLHGEFASH